MEAKKTNSETTEKILEKIKKLMRLQKSSEMTGDVNEANKAAAIIQNLLTEYNLSLDNIGDLNSDVKKDEKVVEDKNMSWFVPTIGGQWRLKMSNTIARFNFCKVLILNKKKRTFAIIGKQENIDVCKYLIDMLSERFLAIGKAEFKKYENTFQYINNPISYDAYVRRFCEGANSGLYDKLKAERNESERKFSQTKVTAIVVYNDKAIDNYMEKHTVKLVHRKEVVTKEMR
jgi:hypothetical protein